MNVNYRWRPSSLRRQEGPMACPERGHRRRPPYFVMGERETSDNEEPDTITCEWLDKLSAVWLQIQVRSRRSDDGELRQRKSAPLGCAIARTRDRSTYREAAAELLAMMPVGRRWHHSHADSTGGVSHKVRSVDTAHIRVCFVIRRLATAGLEQELGQWISSLVRPTRDW